MTKLERKDYCLMTIVGVILLFIYCFHINKLDTICIIGDEFGYWSTGAFLAGFDWSEVASYNPYYSYGYGLWLMIIVRLFSDSMLAYKAAIFLNAIFIEIAYIILSFFAIKHLEVTNKKLVIISSFVSMLFAGTFFSAQTTQCETVFALFFIIEVVLLYEYLKKNKIKDLILVCINAIYLYTIHQRALVVLIALCIVLVIQIFCCTKKWSHLIIGFGIVAIAWYISDLGKEILLEQLYLSGQAVYSNNYAGQTGKLMMLFTATGIKKFLFSVLGKIYYLSVSTFGIFSIGIAVCIKDTYKGIRSIKNKQRVAYLELGAFFLILMFLGTIAISTIQLMDNTRIDTLIYGRYSEYIIQPIILYGIFSLFYEKKEKLIKGILIIQVMLAVLMCYQLESGNYSVFYPNNVSALGVLYYDVWDKEAFICYAVIITNIVMLVANLFFKMKNIEKSWMISLLCIAITWCYLGISAAERQLYIFSSESSDLELHTLLNELSDDLNIYYCPADSTDSFSYLHADYLQYISFENTIHMIDQPLCEVSVTDKDFLVISSSAEIDYQWLDEFVILKETPHFILLAKKESEAFEYYISNVEEHSCNL